MFGATLSGWLGVPFALCPYIQTVYHSWLHTKWAATWDFHKCGMCDQQRLRPACAYAQSDQRLSMSLAYSMSVKLLTEHHIEFLSLKGGCGGSSESTLVKMPHCWKSHVVAQILLWCIGMNVSDFNMAVKICAEHIVPFLQLAYHYYVSASKTLYIKLDTQIVALIVFVQCSKSIFLHTYMPYVPQVSYFQMHTTIGHRHLNCK